MTRQADRDGSDHFWPATVVAAFPLLVIVGFIAIDVRPLADLSPDARQGLYSAFASAAGALLGFSIAALAILIALPSTELVRRLRRYRSWQALLELLVAEMIVVSLLLGSSMCALLLDAGNVHREWLGVLVLGAALSAGWGIALITAFFAMVIAVLGKQWRQD